MLYGRGDLSFYLCQLVRAVGTGHGALQRELKRLDAPDILKILADYADAGNVDRLYTDELPLLESAGFDITIAGASLLGKDARRVANQETVESVAKMLGDTNLKQELLDQLFQAGPRSDESFARHCTLLLDNFHDGFTKEDHGD